jgi:serine/threonine protein kinase
MKNDLKVLQDNNCSFLVKFFGAFFFEGNVKIVLEYMDLGSLDKVIDKIKINTKPCAPEAILSKITQEVFLNNYLILIFLIYIILLDSSRTFIFT